MPASLVKLLALLPIPAIVALVIWAGRRPAPGASAGAGKAETSKTAGGGGVALPPTPAPGWRAGEIQRFDKKTLFDRINGAAPPYIAAGFRYSLGGEYRKAGQKEPVTVDAYEMGGAARAFGMYARERDPSYGLIEGVGDEGYLSSGSLNFWRGRFYVKLAGYEEGEAADQALRELAAALAKALPAEQPAVAEVRAALALLPAEERLARGSGYSLPPLDRIAGLANAYVGRYRVGGPSKEDGDEYRLLVVPLKDRAASEARLALVAKHLGAEGSEAKLARLPVKLVDGSEAKALRATASGKVSFFVATPKGLCGGLELPDAARASAAQQRLLGRLAGSASSQPASEPREK